MERTFLDIHVFHPNCKTYVGREVAKVYKEKEQEKKKAYNERIIQVEKGTFTPVVFSTFGGMGQEADRYHKRLAELISEKRHENLY